MNPELEARIAEAVADFATRSPAAQEEILAVQRAGYARSFRPCRDMTDDALLAQHAAWVAYIADATAWGAALAAAAEARDDCLAEMRRRGLVDG